MTHNHKTLRQRIRSKGIRCTSWHRMKGEIELLPISGQTLFKRSGVPIDVLEIELISEGWLLPYETIWGVISSSQGLYRGPISGNIYQDESDYGLPPDDWTEEDFDTITKPTRE